jgi:protein TonB
LVEQFFDLPVRHPILAQIHPKQISWERYMGVMLVLMLHAAVLYGLWSYKLIPTPKETVTLFVNLINPERPKVVEPPKPPPPKPRHLTPPPPKPPPEPPQVVSTAPIVQPAEPVAPPPPLEPVAEQAPVPVPPVVLRDELSVSCPVRSPPVYPLYSRQIREQGRVVLRVELDEQGHISGAKVETSSGSPRLDEAALNAVKEWRCAAPRRDGVPVRAVALQPFNFRLK